MTTDEKMKLAAAACAGQIEAAIAESGFSLGYVLVLVKDEDDGPRSTVMSNLTAPSAQHALALGEENVGANTGKWTAGKLS